MHAQTHTHRDIHKNIRRHTQTMTLKSEALESCSHVKTQEIFQSLPSPWWGGHTQNICQLFAGNQNTVWRRQGNYYLHITKDLLVECHWPWGSIMLILGSDEDPPLEGAVQLFMLRCELFQIALQFMPVIWVLCFIFFKNYCEGYILK